MTVDIRPYLIFSMMISLAVMILVLFRLALNRFLRKKNPKWMSTVVLIALIAFSAAYFLNRDLQIKYNTYFEQECQPDASKDKVAFVIAKGGVFDTDRISAQVAKYYQAVKKDLGIEDAGIERFSGKSIDELDDFVDEVYLKDDVGYIILLGDDLPVAGFQWSYVDGIAFPNASIEYIKTKLQCVNSDCNVPVPLFSDTPEYCPGGPGCKIFGICNDVAISYILPPVNYSSEKKMDFVLKILETYTNYHENFNEIASRYQDTLFLIQSYYRSRERAESGGYVPNADRFDGYLGYDLSLVTVFNNETQQVSDGLENKHKVLYLAVHGLSGIIEMGLHTTEGRYREGVTIETSLKDYSNFSRENGLPALFVESGACENYFVSGSDYCCWPEAFMDSGVWAYYSFATLATPFTSETAVRMREHFSSEQTFGYAIRKYAGRTPLSYFGDILAHF